MGIDRTQHRLDAFNRKRARFGEDVCTIYAPTQVSDGRSGHKLSFTLVASNVECFVEQSGGGVQVERDGVSRTTTHRIEIGSMDETKQTQARLINQGYQILVAARVGGNPEMLFEQPVRERGSFEPLVVLQAVFTEGTRKPASQ